MALIVEDGTAKVDAEAWISVGDADTYHAARGNTDWTGDNAEKEIALRVAAEWILYEYQGRWVGVQKTAEQSLSWPRRYAYTAEGYPIPDDVIPVSLKNLNAEAALLEITGTNLMAPEERGGRIYKKEEQVGPIREATTYTLDAPGGTSYPELDNLVKGLLASSADSSKLLRS